MPSHLRPQCPEQAHIHPEVLIRPVIDARESCNLLRQSIHDVQPPVQVADKQYLNVLRQNAMSTP